MIMGKLTALAVRAATAPGRYQDGGGLMLVVKPTGARSWQVRLQADGKRRDFGLGSAKDISLAEAREKANEIRKLYRSGVDPVAKKRADKFARVAIPNFRTAAEAAHEEHKGSWRNLKHRGDWLSSLKIYVFPSLGELRVDMIEAPMIRDVLLPIWLAKPETARRVRQRIKSVLGWAASRGHRAALDFSVMDAGLPKQPKRDCHFKAMPFTEVPHFVTRVCKDTETVGRLALLFTILTAARSGETRGATWNEIDLISATWTIPAMRMKAGREHVIPLSPSSLAILERAAFLYPGTGDQPLFPGKGGKMVSDMTLTKVLRDMDLNDTVHGFRSAFRDWAAEKMPIMPAMVAEMALAHRVGTSTEQAYLRTDLREMRRALMDAWGQFVAPSLSGASRSIIIAP